MKIEIPFRTFVAILIFAMTTFLLIELRYQILLFFIAMIVAMSLSTVKKFLISKGMLKKIATPLIILLYFGVLFSILFFIIPTLVDQVMDLSFHFPEIKDKILAMPFARSLVKNANELIQNSPDLIKNAKSLLPIIGKQTFGGLLSMGIFFIVSLYMFLDGNRSYRWFRSHFNDRVQEKMDQTVRDIEPIMTAYVFGQVTTSTLAALVVFVSATLLHIPAALTLAVLAAFFDILPGIGFILIAFTSSIMGLATGAEEAFLIFAILTAYHLFESYVLTPYIYGNRMKLSPLVVLLSLIFAGTIGGVPGMIAVLPMVAAYSTIERLWLRELLKPHQLF